MRRREFIAALGGAAAWPLVARAQKAAVPVIGFLDSRSPEALADRLRGFRQGLKDIGYVEGDNVTIFYRWAEVRIRSTAGPRGRTSAATGCRGCREWRSSGCVCCKGGKCDHPHRRHLPRRPGQARSCHGASPVQTPT